ncbi:MAG: hypothetical protein J6D11_01675 [Clostridia bacterium]|nr:hypothetical protein [Clostridia bacterium]
MKKIFILFICLVLAVAAVFSPRVSASQEKKLCIAFGDSIASGYGIDNVNQTYPAIIAKKFGLYCENNAVSGDKSADMLNVISNTPSVKDAALITISIGGNDLIASKDIVLAKAVSDKMGAMGLPSQSVQKFIKEINISGVFNGANINFETIDADMENIFSSLQKNIEDGVKLLRSVNEDAVIIVQTLYNPYLGNPEYQIFGFDVGVLIDPYIQKINNTYYAVQKALDNSFLIADVASGMNGNSAYFYTSWDFHPTTEGHAYMADVIGALYGKSVQTIATSESLTTAEATTQTSILQTTKDIKTHISTVQTTEIPSTSETIQTEVSTQTDNTASTNILTAEPQIPTEPVPPNVGNIKTPIFICIALVALISICSGIIIKRNR